MSLREKKREHNKRENQMRNVKRDTILSATNCPIETKSLKWDSLFFFMCLTSLFMPKYEVRVRVADDVLFIFNF